MASSRFSKRRSLKLPTWFWASLFLAFPAGAALAESAPIPKVWYTYSGVARQKPADPKALGDLSIHNPQDIDTLIFTVAPQLDKDGKPIPNSQTFLYKKGLDGHMSSTGKSMPQGTAIKPLFVESFGSRMFYGFNPPPDPKVPADTVFWIDGRSLQPKGAAPKT